MCVCACVCVYVHLFVPINNSCVCGQQIVSFFPALHPTPLLTGPTAIEYIKSAQTAVVDTGLGPMYVCPLFLCSCTRFHKPSTFLLHALLITVNDCALRLLTQHFPKPESGLAC